MKTQNLYHKLHFCFVILSACFIVLLLFSAFYSKIKIEKRKSEKGMPKREQTDRDVSLLKNSFKILQQKLHNFEMFSRFGKSWESKVGPFWDVIHGYNEPGKDNYLFIKRNVNHKTCLVTEKKCDHNYKVLILVTSHIFHFFRRETIRNTWGNDKNLEKPRWKTVFLVGRTEKKDYLQRIHAENELYGDIIIGNVFEDFYNLTYKVQMGFEWATRYCDFQFLLKADDDVFINIPRLFDFLNNPDLPKTELYTGNVHFQAGVQRSGRYGVEKDEFNGNIYPRYCSGGGFVLSRDAVERMVSVFNVVKPLKIDDAYVGALALKAGIDVLHNDHFKMFESGTRCNYNKKIIVHHPVKRRECMEALFRKSLTK